MQRKGRVLVAAILIFLGATREAGAWGQIMLENEAEGGTVTQDQFQSVARELGLASASIPLAPAEPLGLLGIDAGFGVSVADLRDEEEFWHAATENRNPCPVFILPQLLVRKGIPGGVDFGVSYTPKVLGNDLSVIGGEVKWSFIQGSMLTPAMAVRLDYHRVLEAEDFTLQTASGDISISKGFGPIIPYTGVGMVFIFCDTDAPVIGSGVPLKPAELRELKGYAGMRLTLGFIQLNPEIDLARDFLIYSLKFGIVLSI